VAAPFPWTLWLSATGDGWWNTGGWAHGLVFAVLFCALVDFVKLIVELMGRNGERRFTTDSSLVTAVIPCRNGAAELPVTILELRRALPGVRILLIDDASTDGTCRVASSMGVEVHRFERNKGKAGAINYAVHRVRTPLTLLLDDDTRIGGARIPTSLISHDGYDAVAFHVLPDRRDREGASGNHFLGHVQRYEYGKSMEIGKRFHDGTHSVCCVSGAIGLFRTADLNELHHRHSGVFQGEDLQRTLIHLLHDKRIVFANEPAWTVAPARVGPWLRQRLYGWYPGLYHQFGNLCRLLVWRWGSWRLRYEMLYNLFTFVSDPLKIWSMIAIALTPGIRIWSLALYFTYLTFELYPWWVIRQPGTNRHAPISVLLFFPIYGAINTVLRTLSLLTWFWLRFVTGSMRPRRGPQDRIAENP
jgi:cellulose synthase/poly-beta-1,6-N-acetylglucosamine synthase-like glycosyltransferase